MKSPADCWYWCSYKHRKLHENVKTDDSVILQLWRSIVVMTWKASIDEKAISKKTKYVCVCNWVQHICSIFYDFWSRMGSLCVRAGWVDIFFHILCLFSFFLFFLDCGEDNTDVRRNGEMGARLSTYRATSAIWQQSFPWLVCSSFRGQ